MKTPAAQQAGAVDITIKRKIGDRDLDDIVIKNGFTYTDKPVIGKPIRIEGENRYDTNLKVVQRTHAAGKPIFVATGASFPDALSIGPAVAQLDGSLLLVSKRGVDPAALSYVKANVPSKFYIVGGTSAVSKSIEKTLKGIAPVERVAGADRYTTAAKVLDTFFAGKKPSHAFVATGTNFPDALTASAAGGALQAPVVLVNGPRGKTFPGALSKSMKAAGITDVYIVGGPSAVNRNIETSLKSQGFGVNRRAGDGRYQTNLKVNALLDGKGVGIEGVWVATGRNFPDALSAAAPAGKMSQRLALSNGTCLEPQIVDGWTANAQVTLIGGVNVLKPSVQNLTPCK